MDFLLLIFEFQYLIHGEIFKPTAIPFDNNWIVEIENNCCPYYLYVKKFKLDFNSNESFVIFKANNRFFRNEESRRITDVGTIDMGSIKLGELEVLNNMVNGTETDINYYKDIHNNYTTDGVGIIGLNSILNNKDRFLKVIFEKLPQPVWALHLKGYENESSTFTIGDVNHVECTENYTWIDNNDDYSLLNFKAKTLSIENSEFNIKKYAFLIVQEDLKFQLPIQIAKQIANKIGATSYQNDKFLIDCEQKTKDFQLKFDLTGELNDTKIYIQISRLIKTFKEPTNSSPQCYLDINVVNNNDNSNLFEISADYILRDNCVAKNFFD